MKVWGGGEMRVCGGGKDEGLGRRDSDEGIHVGRRDELRHLEKCDKNDEG